jgi:hypothetical protein
VHEFGTTNFSATVSGTLPFTIQWTKNGVAIPGANQLTYTIPLVTSDLNGAVYAITVTNAVSTETSNNATLTVIPAPTNPHRLLVDFGNNATQTLHGSSPDDPVYYWNNVTPTIGDTSSGQLANLVTDENVSTGTKISMVSRFNGANSSGTLTSSMYAVDATRDSLVGNTETSGGLSNIVPSFRLSGLNPDWIYHLTFYASRTSVADNRTARYTVTGIISSFDELNASNNVDGTAVVPGMMPTAAGQLLITITPGAANNNANHFTYLGTLEINGDPVPDAPVINSAATANGKFGEAFSYDITATNSPILFDATPLPL